MKTMRELIERCWKGYEPVPGKTPYSNDSCRKKQGKKTKKKKKVKEDFYYRTAKLLEAAWQKKAGKNPEGGLNQKGVDSYKRENPGSKLKTAVTTKPSKLKKGSKSAKRRKSFCARMSGMRKRQKASNNTGKDRLSLSLKKWNC
jgi:hypothetical protein